MHRKAVAKGMGGDFLLDPRLGLIVFQNLPEALAAHAAAADIYKQRRLRKV